MIRSRCTVCGRPAVYRCKYCGDTLCREHLPPDRHWCVGIGYEQDRRPGRIFNTGIFRIFYHNYSYILMSIIVLSFILQLVIPGYTDFMILNPNTLTSRPWTLITHIFLHSVQRPEHLIINLLVFFFFAPLLERRVGSRKFLLIFLLSGIFAGLGYSLSSANPALGASGAISGILGALVILMPRIRVYVFPLPVPLELWMMVILFALYDLVSIGAPDRIAHTAHLSGLIFGLFAGWLESRY